MKVYFDATPSKIEAYRQTYQTIGQTIESLGHQLTSRWILDFSEDFYGLPREEWKNHYKRIVLSLEKADLVVVDISVSSTSIGQLIQQAFILGKPVIALRDRAVTPNIFLEGAGEVESKILIIEYTLANLKPRLTEAFDFIEDWLETRFTMLIGGDIKRHLDKVAKSGENRSTYLRRLIQEDREKNWQ